MDTDRRKLILVGVAAGLAVAILAIVLLKGSQEPPIQVVEVAPGVNARTADEPEFLPGHVSEERY